MKRITSPTHRFDRWMYRGARPNRVARTLNAPWAMLSSAGVWPARMVTLRVPGRHTGKSTSVPLVVVTYEGERYLVSMLGPQANWVQNVQAANGDAVLQHGRSESVHLIEVEPAERAAILRQYLEVAPGARPHVPVHRKAPVEDFAAIAADFPVFRITSAAAPAAS